MSSFPSPLCYANSIIPPVTVVAGATVLIQLVSSVGVISWVLSCIGTDQQNSAAAINAELAATFNPASLTASYTQPSTNGSALLFQSTVTDGTGVVIPYTTFKVKTLSQSGGSLAALNETDENDPLGFGGLAIINQVALSGQQVSVVSKSATYSVNTGDYVILTTGNAFTITLPVPTSGRVLIIKDAAGNASTQNKTISQNATEKIDGANTYVLNLNYSSIMLVSDGTNWFVAAVASGIVV